MVDLDCLNLGSLRLKSPEEWNSAGNELWFVFPQGGAGKYVVDSEVRQLLPGSVLVLNATSGGKLCATNGGEITFAFFSARFEHLIPLCDAQKMCLLQSVTDGFAVPRLHPPGSDLARECHHLLAEVPANLGLEHRVQLLKVIAVLLAAELKNVQAQRIGFVGATEHVVQVLEKLSADDIISLSVEELAVKFSCSRRHLNRLFHQYFGVSVATLKMEMRLLRAASLLQDPEVKIINVAEQCGFNYLGLFNTCFKRRFGTNPGKWRKMHAAIERPIVGPAADNAGCKMRAGGLCPWSIKAAKSKVLKINERPRIVNLRDQKHPASVSGKNRKSVDEIDLKPASFLRFQVHA